MTDSAWRRSANGSLSPVGFSPMPQHAHQRFQLVGHCQHFADEIGDVGSFVAGEARLVVVLDGEGDLLVLAIVRA